MLRTVKFTGRTGRFDVPSFLWTENDNLEIKLDLQTCKQGVFLAVVKYGKSTFTKKLHEDKTIILTPDMLKENVGGPLEILLELRTIDATRIIVPSGRENGGYFIEPLLIEYVDTTFTAVGWLTRIENGMQKMALQIEELQETVDGMYKNIEQAKNEAIVTATGGDLLNG
jgi:hypothetical protein